MKRLFQSYPTLAKNAVFILLIIAIMLIGISMKARVVPNEISISSQVK